MRLERGDDENPHCEERDPVAARLSRDVEEHRRHRREKEEEEAGQRAESRVQPRGDEDDTGDEWQDRQEPQGDLRLSDDRARGPGEDSHELVAQVRPGEDPARPAPYERLDHDDLVVPEAVTEADEARPGQGCTEQDVRRHDGDARAHVSRQRTSVRTTRRPS